MSVLHVSDELPRRAKILVAEDHEDTRQLLRTVLEKRGLSVVEAGDGFEAVTAAEREQPDLILMDGGLPLLDGIGVTRRLRRLPSLSTVPIIFLSGHAGPQAQADALDAGCDEYVTKPFDLARLDRVLNRHLPGGGGQHDEEVLPDAMTQMGIGAGIRGDGASLRRESTRRPKLFGLVEIDAEGKVLYSRFEADGALPDGNAPDYTGLNFYSEVVPFSNVAEFRNQCDNFRRGPQPAQSMDFICDYEDGPLPVRVLLARIRERSETDVTKSILVHIRRAQ